ncbi:MAG: response regulator, partial [Leptospiraceae bacterium]|nr:response regulator [Leptospiraceae bacterium]
VFFAPAQKWVERISWMVCGVFILTLAWPQRTYSPISVYYYGWTLLICLWILFSLAGAIRKRKLGSLVSFLALIFLFLAVANDTLLSQGWIRSGYLFPYVFILFVLGQSYILIRRFTAAFNTAEHLTDNLKFEVRQRTRELAEKNDRLQAITRQQREFFHNVSHELRTPLTLIYGPLQSLQAGEYGEVPESMNQPLELMLRSGRRLQRLINQLLDLARLEAGFLRLNLETVDLGKLLEEVIQPFLPLAQKKEVSLKYKAEPNLMCKVDPDKMDKVLYNLISNALKYTKSGGIIRLSAGLENDQIRIRISDSGPGIPAESLPRIFDRFYQVDDSRPTEREGTGIGLAIVSEFVKMHDGTISVDSEPGVGSSFLIVLPRRLSEESAENSTVASGQDPTVGDRAAQNAPSEARLMIVEDSPDMRDFISHILRGYNLTIAENGMEALQLARENPPDAILSDLMMPEMDGLEFLARLKSEPSLSSIPFAMLTARSDPEDENEGADYYLQKPFRPEALRALVRQMTAGAPRD